MKKLTLILLIFPCILIAQDNRAKQILDELSSKTRTYSTIKAKFTNTFNSTVTDLNESQTGTIFIKNNSYRLEMNGQTIISDGETNWIYLKDENEVNITETDDEENELNPSKIFTIYESGYKYKFIKEDKESYHIDLFPNENGPFSKIELFINKPKMQISSFIMFDKQGSIYKYTIDSFSVNKKIEDNFFMFQISNYPNIEVIDLR